jgi:hypothetical protein
VPGPAWAPRAVTLMTRRTGAAVRQLGLAQDHACSSAADNALIKAVKGLAHRHLVTSRALRTGPKIWKSRPNRRRSLRWPRWWSRPPRCSRLRGLSVGRLHRHRLGAGSLGVVTSVRDQTTGEDLGIEGHVCGKVRFGDRVGFEASRNGEVVAAELTRPSENQPSSAPLPST